VKGGGASNGDEEGMVGVSDKEEEGDIGND
jgi:hypothetical protein